MITAITQAGVAPTMFWVYAATALLVVLFVLLVAPYFGVLGDRDIEVESDRTDHSDYSDHSEGHWPWHFRSSTSVS